MSLDVGEGLHEIIAQVMDALAEATGELFIGGGKCEVRAGVDKVADGFGLGEVDAAIDKGAPGEFTRLSATRAACQNGF